LELRKGLGLWESALVQRYVGAVHDGRNVGDAPASVRRVFARVNLQSSVHAELAASADGHVSSKRVIMMSGNTKNLSLHVSLSAKDSVGRCIRTPGRDFGISGPRRGVWHRWHGPSLPEDRNETERPALTEHRVDVHDIEDGVNQMLGRDPSLHHPPRLSWHNLIHVLDEADVPVTERELIDVPLTIELTPEVQAELDGA
jgi:hypothetical protein